MSNPKIKIVFEADQSSVKKVTEDVKKAVDDASRQIKPVNPFFDFPKQKREMLYGMEQIKYVLKDLSAEQLAEEFVRVNNRLSKLPPEIRTARNEMAALEKIITRVSGDNVKFNFTEALATDQYEELLGFVKKLNEEVLELGGIDLAEATNGRELIAIFKKMGSEADSSLNSVMNRFRELVNAVRSEEDKLGKDRDKNFQTYEEKQEAIRQKIIQTNKAREEALRLQREAADATVPMEINEGMNAQLENITGLLQEQESITERIKKNVLKIGGGFKNVAKGIRKGINGALETTLARMLSWAAVAGMVKKVFTALVMEMKEGEEVLKRMKAMNRDGKMATGGQYNKNDVAKYAEYDYLANYDRQGERVNMRGGWDMMRNRFGGEQSANEFGKMEKTGVQRFRQLSTIALANDSSGSSFDSFFSNYDRAAERGYMDSDGLENMLKMAPSMMKSLMAVSGMDEDEIRKQAGSKDGIRMKMLDKAIMRNSKREDTVGAWNENAGHDFYKGPSKETRARYKQFYAPDSQASTWEIMNRWDADATAKLGEMWEVTTGDRERKKKELGKNEAYMNQSRTAADMADQKAYEDKRKVRQGQGSWISQGLNMFGGAVDAGIDVVQGTPEWIAQQKDKGENFFERRKIRNERNEKREEKEEKKQQEAAKEKEDQEKYFANLRKKMKRQEERKEREEKRKNDKLGRENVKEQRNIDRNRDKMADLTQARMEALRGQLGKTVNIKGLQSSIQQKLSGGEDTYESRMETLQKENKKSLDIIAENSKKFGFQ